MNTNGKEYVKGNSGGSNSIWQNHSNNVELIDFKQISTIIRRYMWLIILSAIVCTGAAYYLAFEYFEPVYRSQASVLISASPDNFTGGNTEIGKIVSSSYNLNGNSSIESEIQFLKSRELSNEVAHQIMSAKYLPGGQLYPVLWTDYPEDSTIVSEQTLSGRIQSKLNVAPIEPGSNILGVTVESYSPYEAQRLVNFSLNTYKDITAQKKRASATSALEFLEQEKERVGGQLEDAENELSNFMSNEDLVAIDSQTDNLVNTLSNLQTQKQEIVIKLEAAKSAINNYENQLQAIRPDLGDKYSQAAGPTITKYQEELAKLSTQRLILVSNNPQLKENPDSEPRLQKLDTQIADLKSEIKRLTDNIMSGNSDLLGVLAGTDGNVTREISQIRNNLTELKIEESQYQAQLQAINNRLQNNQAFLNRVPDNKKRLERLQRQVSVYEELFLTVNKQASQVSLWKESQKGAGTIIDYAGVNNNPVKPQKVIWLGMSFFLGLALPLGFVLIKEALSSKIKSIAALKNKDYPLLAVIYDHNTLNKKELKKLSKTSVDKNKNISDDLILYHYGLSPIAESYRNMVSKILYSRPDDSPSTLLITSPKAGEGKTTLTSNMATALTEMGKRVLIIDCDMRKPSVHKLFGVSKEPGIMEALFQDISPESAVKSLPVPGLYTLTAGQKQPTRPNTIISSKAFRKMIKKFKLEYDFILLDSPPFGIIGDSAPLLQLTDGVIVTTKFLSTKHVELNYTIEELEKNSAEILGLVLNWYNPKKSLDDTQVKKLYSDLYKGYYEYQKKPSNKKRVSHEELN